MAIIIKKIVLLQKHRWKIIKTSLYKIIKVFISLTTRMEIYILRYKKTIMKRSLKMKCREI